MTMVTACLPACWLLGALVFSTAAEAAIHVCAQPDGRVVYQDRPCPIASASRQAAASDTAAIKPVPLGMHESWFERPANAQGTALCTARQCSCGALTRPLNFDVVQAVADALYIDGSWHRHTELRASSGEGSSNVDRVQLADEQQLAACDIMIAQLILRRHARTAVQTLQRQVSERPAQGGDDEERQAMLLADVAALRRPRK